MDAEPAEARGAPAWTERPSFASGLVVAAALLVASPILFVRYLPMTDLPQHLALAAILEHLDDRAYGFSDYYEPAADPGRRTLPYALQFVLVRGLAGFVPLDLAMHGFVFLAAVSLPLGVLAVLRAQGKPSWLALLALPFVYNRAWFWGFASFQLSIGLGLAAIALLVRERFGVLSALGVAGLSVAVVFTHVYGIAFLLGYLVLWPLAGDRRTWRRRAPAAAIPAVLGGAAWAATGAGAPGFGTTWFPPVMQRLTGLPNAILGGYRDPSEPLLLLATGALFVLLAYRSLPLSRGRLAVLAPSERVLWGYLLLNLALYFALPQHTPSAKFVHFRHAVLAAVLAPLLLPRDALRDWPRLAPFGLAAIAAAAIASAWIHLLLFDREARSFDDVLAALPERPRVVALTFERNGRYTRTVPYVHFAAYAQARRGGLLATSFPGFFWNLPLRLREDAGIPPTPVSLEMHPRRFDFASFGHYYDHVVVRGETRDGGPHPRTPGFPYELVYEAPPWRLFRAADP